jgi:hypothetical protein
MTWKKVRTRLCGLLVFFAASCGGDEGAAPVPDQHQPPDIPLPTSIDTVLSTDNVHAGESLEYTCVDEQGATIPNAAVAVIVSGPDALVLEHGTFTPTIAGGYGLQCMIPGTDLVDPEPAFLQVDAGPAATADTVVDPEWIKAGESATVTCSFEDTYGNTLLSAGSYKVLPDEGVTIAGAKVKATRVGTHQVICYDEETGVEDLSAALLYVVPALPKTLITQLDPDIVAAGSPSTVTCVVQDKYGNLIPPSDFPMVLEHSDMLQRDGLEVVGTVTGNYQISCLPQNEDPSYFEIVPDELRILAGAADRIELAVVPDKDLYGVGEHVILTVKVYDAYDNLNPYPQLAPIVVIPEEGVNVLDEEELVFKEEGAFLVRVGIEDQDEPVAERTFVVDGSGPLVSFDSPGRGETRTGKPVLNVGGTINDPFAGLQLFEINDVSVPVNADGSFNRVQGLYPALNLVQWRAVDLGGNETDGLRGVYYSPVWYPYGNEIQADSYVPRGMILSFGVDFVDDGVHDHNNPDDLATILEIVELLQPRGRDLEPRGDCRPLSTPDEWGDHEPAHGVFGAAQWCPVRGGPYREPEREH